MAASCGEESFEGQERAAGNTAEARANVEGNAANPRIGAGCKPGSLQEEQAGEVVKTARSERRRVARERGGNPRLEGPERGWEWTPAGWNDGEVIFGNPYGGSEADH